MKNVFLKAVAYLFVAYFNIAEFWIRHKTPKYYEG